MVSDRIRRILLQLTGVLCYIAGFVFFVVVAIGVYSAPPAHSIENLSIEHVPALLISVVLIVCGRYLSYRFSHGFGSVIGQTDPSYRSKYRGSILSEYGIRDSNEQSRSSEPRITYENGVVYAYCPECGSKNEREYSFCGNCSSKLSR